MSSSKRDIGYRISFTGGVVALVAFFFFPYLQEISFSSVQFMMGLDVAKNIQGDWLFWLQPIVALLASVIAGWKLASVSYWQPGKLERAATALVVLGIFTLLIFLCKYSYDIRQPEGNSWYAVGFWLYLGGIATVIAGGLVAVGSSDSK